MSFHDQEPYHIRSKGCVVSGARAVWYPDQELCCIRSKSCVVFGARTVLGQEQEAISRQVIELEATAVSHQEKELYRVKNKSRVVTENKNSASLARAIFH